MTDISMIREPEVEQRGRGLRRWSVAWGLFDHDTQRAYTRRKLFLTQRAAERWIEGKRIKPGDRWHAVIPPAEPYLCEPCRNGEHWRCSEPGTCQCTEPVDGEAKP